MRIDFRLYLITDRKQLSVSGDPGAEGRSLLSSVRKALNGGVRAVQLREKDLDTRDILKLAYRMRKLTAEYGAKLFINDRFDIALAVEADGVHLTQNSIPVEYVRSAVGNKLMIGVSTHSLKEAGNAEKGGADFLTLGPVYMTPSKLKYGDPLGTAKFRSIAEKIQLPAFALGGVTSERIGEIRDAGAYGVAMISGILGAADIRKKVSDINEIINTGSLTV